MTATAVRNKLSEFPEYQEVSPQAKPDLGIISPGLVTEEYRKKYSFPIISEIEWAYLLFKHLGKLPFFIAISGTNGKTTTTHLVADLLDIPMAGNVGIPLINYVSKNLTEIPVSFSLEMSSYQIEQSPAFTPDIYILMTITEDHLDRHKTMDNYANVKMSLAERQSENQAFIYNGADEWIVKKVKKLKNKKVRLIDFTRGRKMFAKELAASPLLGKHNEDNLLAALSAAALVKKKSYVQKVKKIKKIPHRLEPVGIVKNIEFINDSKATNPDSTIAALKSINVKRMILLLGGQKKQASYEPMFELIRKGRIRVLTFGEAREFFNENLRSVGLVLASKPTMKEAVKTAFKKAADRDIIVLSPGCASFDEFHNFEERGNVFRKLVSGLSAEK